MATAVAYVASQVGMYAFQLASGAGASITTAATIANVAYAAAYAGTTLAITAGLTAATRPDVPTPEAGKLNLRQPIPPSTRGMGRCRRAGAYMLTEASKNVLQRVVVFNGSRVAAINRYWMHDDEVTVVSNVVQQLASGAYETGRVKIEIRYGAATETAYAGPIADLPSGTWTSSHRLDGLASFNLRCQNGKLADFNKQFPKGNDPQASVEADHIAYDWRDESQDREDPSTWLYCENPVVQYVNDLWTLRGYDWARRFAPSLEILTASADYCDELVEKKDSSTEKRYTIAGFYELTNDPSEVHARIRDTFDGFMSVRGDGAVVILPGRYDEPTVTFGPQHIVGYELQTFVEKENATNVLKLAFTDPGQDYTLVDLPDWRDQDSIDAIGEKTGSFSGQWVTSQSQLRRLAKRKVVKANAPIRGRLILNMAGLRGLGERFLRIQEPADDDLADLVVEVTGPPEIDIAGLTVAFPIIAADTNIDAWNPATEEGDGPTGETRVEGEALVAPTITDLDAFLESVGQGGYGVRLRATVTMPDRDDATPAIRWRVVGATSWVEATTTDVDPGAGTVLETGFVTADTNVEAEVAFVTGAGTISPWSSAVSVSTSTAAAAPAPPTGLVGVGGVGIADLTWSNPASPNFAAAEVFHNTSNVFPGGGPLVSIPGAPGSGEDYQATGLSAGTHYFWVTAENGGGTPSLPTGPAVVTVT